jgi:putative ABC transport system permease protein
VNQIFRDIHFAFRQILRNPGFAAVAVLAVALGIGPNTAIFSVVYATLLAPMPYPNPDQLVMVWSKINGGRNGVSAGDYTDWKQQSTAFQELAAFTSNSYNLATRDAPEQIRGQTANANWFRMLGVPFFMGSGFAADADLPGKNHVLVISHRAWVHRFGSDPRIIGKNIRLNGEPYRVVGVLQSGQSDRLDAEIWVPLTFKPEQVNHDFHWLLVMGRLKPGVSIAQAQQNMNAVTKHIGEIYPKSNKGWGALVEPLQNDFLDPDTKTSLWLLLGAVSFVLLIASVNVANLLLARGTARQREVAVRISIGASPMQLFRQLLTESLTLALVGGALGIALSLILLKLIMATMPPGTLPSEADVHLSLPVLLFTLLATILAGVLFGCAPAWQATDVDPNENLKQGGRSVSSGHRGLRNALVVVEFALALSLLAGAGLTIHSFMNRTNVDLGIKSDHILTFFLPVPDGKLTQPEQINSFYGELLRRIEAVPGVKQASASTGFPLEGTGFGMPFNLAGATVSDPSSRPGAGFQMATPGYFETFGVQLTKGRSFTEQDRASSMPVAMVNEAFVHKYLAGKDPMTQRIEVEQLVPGVTKLGPPISWQIIGVFHDVQNGGRLGDPNRPEIDVPFWQSPWPGAGIAVRTGIEPEQMQKAIAAAVHSLDPTLPLADVRTMEQVKDNRFVGDRFGMILYGSLAGVALLLAALGIYGVMQFTVAQRIPEIGLRMALGAGQGHVIAAVLREGITLAGGGLLIGTAGAYLVGRAMQSTLYGTGAMDWPAFGAVAVILLLAALLACYVPARRASSVDPVIALREE